MVRDNWVTRGLQKKPKWKIESDVTKTMLDFVNFLFVLVGGVGNQKRTENYGEN